MVGPGHSFAFSHVSGAPTSAKLLRSLCAAPSFCRASAALGTKKQEGVFPTNEERVDCEITMLLD